MTTFTITYYTAFLIFLAFMAVYGLTIRAWHAQRDGLEYQAAVLVTDLRHAQHSLSYVLRHHPHIYDAGTTWATQEIERLHAESDCPF